MSHWNPPKTQKEANSLQARRTMRVKSLADYIHSEMAPKDFFFWLREVAAGRDPDAPEGFHTPIEMRYRMMAMKMLLERAYGGVPQHLTLEGEVTTGASEALRQLPDDKLMELRRTMRALLAPPKPIVDTSES
jgi:hypothetical protein